MGLKNLLIVVLVLWVGVVLWRRWQAANRSSRGAGRPERMVRCEQCGVYLPRGEAVARGEERYACASHSAPPRA
ncbi:MAG TPA: PP0621 family protein [Gammaproteobacteria bacterium]|nr:PP0621 family protein [Gammaproteobacteria bacterium]